MYKPFALLAGLAFLQPAVAQQTPKKPLDHSVYDQWQSVANQKISQNGKYVLFQVKPQQGDGTLYFKTAANETLRQVSRGDSAQFTADSKFAVFSIRPPYQVVRQAKIKKKKPADMPKDSLGVYTLAGNKLSKYPNVKSFQLAEEAAVLAFLGERLPVKDAAKKAPTDTIKKLTDQLLETKKEGAPLTVVNLLTGKTSTFEYVTEFQISKPGNKVGFAVTAPKGNKDVKSGLYVLDVASGTAKLVSAGKGVYKNIAFDEAGKQVAFTAEKHPEKALAKPFSLYYSDLGADSARVLLAPSGAPLRKGWSPSGFGKVSFSKNGEKLFFGTAPDPIPQDTSIVDFETAKLDIWNYKDDYLQPMQLKTLKKDLQRNYLAVIYPKKGGKFVQLENEHLRDSFLPENTNAEYILAVTDTGKRVSMQWEGTTLKQAYLVSTVSGEFVAINPKAAKSRFQMSPDGKYVVWYDYANKNWFAYGVDGRKTVNLTGKTGVSFTDEENDSPDDPQPYGLAAWTKDDAAVLLYDRYDIWKVDPKTGVAVNFTGGVGRSTKQIFRYTIPVDKKKFIEPKEELLLLVQNETTKQWGYSRKSINSLKAPEQLVMAPFGYSNLMQAKKGDTFIYTKSNVSTSPDLYVSRDLKKETKLSSINPQQKDYNWFTADLVHWTTPKGYRATGVLYKPENFDPAKKYPMVVYFYEKLSDGLYKYTAPAPTPSRLDIAMFASNGYLVFTPDISYTIGEPGPSAMEFINSGVEDLKKNSWVDGAHIGLQGQSWGGYQVAYLITQTNMYAAAWAGAPVVNMTSAYGGIRWESGMSRQFQYEHTQSRIGGTLWDQTDRYIQNSPLFHLPKVQTPVVIMSNDADGAVPWYQGIEMFTDLRRLGKPVWLLQYNGEAHNLVKRENRKDISVRELQFFDHYLKGAPAPVWLQRGVPAVEKGRNWGLETTSSSAVKTAP
ncbi:S9 family peptidase [Hymenobacter cellulosivorans]|uniref:Prolyl oligopeptidase family serine peptidase n=1 Tax=Hymenobacter cellulosivorans TaxID=2932249 RepID=A0ABY4FBH8_9BACT|nr:prolyl oligopeptidase family serine peptidase [Hymenobacter cellulosivorans]UOQ53869.1 prolyl oligopeptidase family serine peptidase [Hymenobacter cellulosivorans]